MTDPMTTDPQITVLLWLLALYGAACLGDWLERRWARRKAGSR